MGTSVLPTSGRCTCHGFLFIFCDFVCILRFPPLNPVRHRENRETIGVTLDDWDVGSVNWKIIEDCE